jgi:hypothetical protein
MRNKTANGRLLNIKEAILLVSRAVGAAVLGVVALSVSYELILRPRHVFNVQHEHFLRANPKAILVGDSRGVHGIRRIDANVYNYSHFGEYPFAQILRARHAMRDKAEIRAVVMQIDAYVVQRNRAFAPLGSSRGFYEALLFASLEDVQKVVGPNRQELWRNILGFVFPLSIWWEREDFWGALRLGLTELGLDNAPHQTRYFNTCGDLVNDHPSLAAVANAEQVKLARTEAEARYRSNKFDPSVAKLYDEFIKEAKARGVVVIGIRFPETAEYRAAAEPMIDPAAEEYIASLGIPILDYRDGLSSALFTDPDHLSDAGAATLSRRFVADLQTLLHIPAEPLKCSSRVPLRTNAWPYAGIISALHRLVLDWSRSP